MSAGESLYPAWPFRIDRWRVRGARSITAQAACAWWTVAGSPSGDQRDLLGERTGSPWRDLPERYGDLAAAVRTDEIHRPRCSSCRHQLMVPAPLLLFSAEPAPLLLFSPSDEAAEDASEHAARL